MDGVRRVHGVRQKQAPAFSLAQLKRLVRGLDTQTVAGLRDRALLELLYATGDQVEEGVQLLSFQA